MGHLWLLILFIYFIKVFYPDFLHMIPLFTKTNAIMKVSIEARRTSFKVSSNKTGREVVIELKPWR